MGKNWVFLALLKIKPAPNNGTLGSLNKLLLPNAKSTPSTSQSDGTVFRQDICQFPKNYSFENKSSQVFLFICKIWHRLFITLKCSVANSKKMPIVILSCRSYFPLALSVIFFSFRSFNWMWTC